MKHHVILKNIALILIPFMFMFGGYVLFHGEVSPGGGFQGGAIWATAICLYAVIFSVEKAKKLISPKTLRIMAASGCIIYALFGFAAIALGHNFLDYSALSSNPHLGQKFGILGIEIGVQLTVFAVLTMIFFRIASQED